MLDEGIGDRLVEGELEIALGAGKRREGLRFGTGGRFMKQKFDYKFVRLGEGLFKATGEARDGYRDAVQHHAREGWRLVQIFAPGIGLYGKAKYYELILEREVGE